MIIKKLILLVCICCFSSNVAFSVQRTNKPTREERRQAILKKIHKLEKKIKKEKEKVAVTKRVLKKLKTMRDNSKKDLEALKKDSWVEDKAQRVYQAEILYKSSVVGVEMAIKDVESTRKKISDLESKLKNLHMEKDKLEKPPFRFVPHAEAADLPPNFGHDWDNEQNRDHFDNILLGNDDMLDNMDQVIHHHLLGNDGFNGGIPLWGGEDFGNNGNGPVWDGGGGDWGGEEVNEIYLRLDEAFPDDDQMMFF